MSQLSILLVGTGRMAQQHAERFAEIDNAQVVAAVDIDETRVKAFCKEHAIPAAYTDLATALSECQLDAASIVTPDAFHAQSSIDCLQAGLAVLCEKPLSDSPEASARMVEVAESSGLLNMVNLSYRTSGALSQARQLIDDGQLGEIRHVEASYRQSWLCSPYWGDWKTEDAWLWRLSSQHGSAGVLGDIGIHILDYVTAGVGLDIAGLQCRLKTFNKAPGNRIGDYVLDANDSCVINLEFGNGALGVVHMSRFQTGYMNDLFLTIHGTQGAVKVSTGNEGDKLFACLGDDIHTQTFQAIPCQPQPDTFERFMTALASGNKAGPDFAHAARLQSVMDDCFTSNEQGCWVESDSASSLDKTA